MKSGGVLQVTLTVDKGGLENMVSNLAIGLQGSGWDSAVIALDAAGVNESRLREAGVDCHVLAGRSLGSLAFHWRLRGLLRRLRPAIVHTHHFSPLLHAMVAALGLGLNERWIHTEHAHEYLADRLGYQRVLRQLAKRVDRFAVVGRHQVEYYVGTVGISSDRVVVVENGVNTERFRPSSDGRRSRPWPFSSGFIAVTAARLSPEKAQQTMVEAIGLCQQRGRAGDIHLVLIGDGSERAALEARAEELGVRGRVHFLGWRDDLPGLLSAADVFVLSSVSEGLPLAVLEGMACGLPVLTTPVGDLPRVVHEGETGGFFPVHDAAALAGRLMAMAGDLSRTRRMGEKARRFVVESHSEIKMIQRYIDLYQA